MPIAATILGAAKLTGKITPTTNFGTLQALTGRVQADVQTGGLASQAEVEPLTHYSVTRALKEFGGRRAGLGAITTTVLRDFREAALENQLNRSSLMSGMDGWYFLDPKQLWVLSGWVAGSNINGTAPRITAVQRSSRHYFQRPDAANVEVDPNATSLTGFAGRVWLNKQSGRIMSNTAIGYISPRFDVNDIGLQSRSDVINAHTMLGHQWTKDGRFKRYANVWTGVAASRNLDGDITFADLETGGNVNYKNNWNNWWNAGYFPSFTDTRATRGGPKMKTTQQFYVNAGFNTNSYKKTFLSPWFYFDWNEAGGYSRDGGFYVEWKPKSNLLVSVGPWVNANHQDAQYVTTIPDAGATATYGNRYVFAELDQTTVGADLRVNWTFTPNLSLETYVQPFTSSGEYRQSKSLAQPGTYSFDPHPLQVEDFDFRSLRGNAVLRWEYSPGSALFLVWTQQRDDFEQVGEFSMRRSMTRMLDAQADNVFMVKVSYHLGL